MESVNEGDDRVQILSNDSNVSGGRSVSLSVSPPKYPKVAGAVVLIIVILEKTAFYAFASNLYLFLNHQPFAWASYNAATALLIFTGISYASSLIGGWLTDSIIGRYWTLCVSFLLYIAGYAFLPVISSDASYVPKICFLKKVPNCPSNTSSPAVAAVSSNYYESSQSKPSCISQGPVACLWLVYVTITLIGIGSGIFRTVIPPFGADQLLHPNVRTARTYFNWYYWCINIGGFIAIGGLAYVQQSITSGFFWSYVISLALLLLAACLLMGNKWNFRIYPKSGKNIFIDLLKIMAEARRSQKQRTQSLNGSVTSSYGHITLESGTATPSWIDLAKLRYGGKYHETAVEDIKVLGQITLVFFLLIPYWIIYFQMQTTFQAQGLHMRLDPYAPSFPKNASSVTLKSTARDLKAKGKFSVPQAWLCLFDTVFVIIILPVMDRIIFPFLDKRGYHLSLLTRIGFGMLLASMSMFAAGILETYRLNLLRDSNHSNVVVQVIGNTTYYAADIWVLWQAPQYALIGISEVFATAAGLQFAYSEAPKSVQGVIMGLFYLMSGLGSFLGAGILHAVKPYWLKDKDNGNINYGHMNYYFFLLGGFQLVTFIIFYILKKTKLKPRNEST